MASPSSSASSSSAIRLQYLAEQRIGPPDHLRHRGLMGWSEEQRKRLEDWKEQYHWMESPKVEVVLSEAGEILNDVEKKEVMLYLERSLPNLVPVDIQKRLELFLHAAKLNCAPNFKSVQLSKGLLLLLCSKCIDLDPTAEDLEKLERIPPFVLQRLKNLERYAQARAVMKMFEIYSNQNGGFNVALQRAVSEVNGQA